MNEAARTERNLAWRVLAHEAGDDQSVDGLADATERAFDRLYHHLAPLIGPAGFDALAKRALHLARLECPYLGRVVGAIQVDAFQLQGLRASVEGREPDEVREGLVALLGTFFWLLVTFVGDGLFWKLFRGVWPDVPSKDEGLGAEETEE